MNLEIKPKIIKGEKKMEYPITAHTTKCIICLKPATNHCGFVRGNKEDILAGFCEKHEKVNIPDLMNEEGCCGAWHPSYGREKE